MIDPPSRPALAYPARGIAELWQPARHRSQTRWPGCSAGPGPRCWSRWPSRPRRTRLARRHDLAASTVSEHLSALRDARLVASRRQRHAVMYQQTRLGAALAAGG